VSAACLSDSVLSARAPKISRRAHWLSDPDLRQHSHAGLNKGEISNSVRRAVFFHRQGEIRGRTTAEPRAVVNVNCLNVVRFTSGPAVFDFEGETSETRSSRHAANWMSAIIRR
jgi:hypothetical protein